MKAAILHQLGSVPTYDDFPLPVAENDQQVLVSVRAASIKQLDLSKASGKHYTQYASLPTVVGVDGVGVLDNGQRIYAIGVTGMMAQQALVMKDRWVNLPEGLDDALAAALPNALIGSDAALRYRANIKPGHTVLINGATGVTGMIAVQAAKYHGAATVIATGRNQTALQQLKTLGADEIISLEQSDEAIVRQLEAIYNRTQIDIVLDYLWGHPVELILQALKNVKNHQHTKIVAVGEMAGASVSLESGILRSKDLEFIGSGIGSLSPKTLVEYMKQHLPTMLQVAAEGKLQMEIEEINLADVSVGWAKATQSGKRIVINV